MAKIYRLKKEWSRAISSRTFGFRIHNKKGDKFIEEYADYKYPFYYPFDGGYAVWERDDLKFVDEYFEFVEETEHPKEYFTEKKYTEYDMQMALKNKSE